jgi:hypothetical protein
MFVGGVSANNDEGIIVIMDRRGILRRVDAQITNYSIAFAVSIEKWAQ